jgi:hypothetical protein
MKLTNLFRSNKASEQSPIRILRLPRVEPGMNANAEAYFQKELKALGPGTHNSTLERADGPFGMETSVYVKGKKIAQMLRQYDDELGPELSRLGEAGVTVEAEISIDDELEVKILIPFPQELIPWIQASPDVRPLLPLKPPSAVRIKESGKFQAALSAILGTHTEWKGTIRLELGQETSGKYAGKSKLVAFVGDTQIGTIGARYKDQEPALFERVEDAGPLDLKGSIYLSAFDGEPYASVYP